MEVLFNNQHNNWLSKQQPCQRSESMTSTYVWNDAQLNHSDRRQRDVKVFHLTGCAFRAEVPLLSHDFLKRLSTIGRPTQDVLLRALSVGIDKVQPDPP